MKSILVLHRGEGDSSTSVEVLGVDVEIRRSGCGNDSGRVRDRIAEADGSCEAIALEGMPLRLQLGTEHTRHEEGHALARAATRTPIVDGSGVRSGLERWAVNLIEKAQPGILSDRKVLMLPGLNHAGLANALARRASSIWYADPLVYFGLPRFPGVGSHATLRQAAPTTLNVLRKAPISELPPRPGPHRLRRIRKQVAWADVLAGDIRIVREFSPEDLSGKTVLVESADESDLDELRRRGVATVITLMPSLDGAGDLGSRSAAVVEAVLAAVRPEAGPSLTEDTYLDLVSAIEWTPAVRNLQPGEENVNRFAFVIHPLSLAFIHRHPSFRWTRWFPDAIVERAAARFPPMYVSKIRGGRSPLTGKTIEGQLIALSATPREMLRRGPDFTYRRLQRAARMAQKRGARLMGLGAFTSVVGDAGITVDQRSPIAITSGNSLTVAATLEAAKQAAIAMGGTDLTRGRAMIIGATGSIGSVCARMIAQAIRDVVLVSIEPEKLIELKRRILRETPGARVVIAIRSVGLVESCDLIVTATSGFGQRVLDISRCKPGAIVCDVARPPDISDAEAALRPDVLVIESGEVLIPGDIDFGYDIGLPPKVSYACLAETALLAMEGRFESFTVGRELRMEAVKEIYRLFNKHGFRLAGLRSLGRFLTDEDLAGKRALADALRRDPELFERTCHEASVRLNSIPRTSKGVRASSDTRGLFRSPRLADTLTWISARFGRNRV